MTDADWLGKVQRRNVRRGKPHQGEESLRFGWRYLEKGFAILSLSNLGTGDCAEVWLQQQREDEVGVAESRGAKASSIEPKMTCMSTLLSPVISLCSSRSPLLLGRVSQTSQPTSIFSTVNITNKPLRREECLFRCLLRNAAFASTL